MHRPHYHSGPLIATIVLAVLVQSLNAQSGSGFIMCMDGDVRLANQTGGYIGNRMYIQGFVEICYNDSYGAICEDGWDDIDARVVCSELYDASYGMNWAVHDITSVSLHVFHVSVIENRVRMLLPQYDLILTFI